MVRFCQNCQVDISAMHFNTRWCSTCRLARKKVQRAIWKKRYYDSHPEAKEREVARYTAAARADGRKAEQDRRYKLARRARDKP